MFVPRSETTGKTVHKRKFPPPKSVKQIADRFTVELRNSIRIGICWHHSQRIKQLAWKDPSVRRRECRSSQNGWRLFSSLIWWHFVRWKAILLRNQSMSRKYLDIQWEINFFRTKRVWYVAMTIAHSAQMSHFTEPSAYLRNIATLPAMPCRVTKRDSHTGTKSDSTQNASNYIVSTLDMLNTYSQHIEFMLYISFFTKYNL